MNTKLVIIYTNSNGFKGEITEYHLNASAAYDAANSITKRLGPVVIESVKLVPVKKHLELIKLNPISSTDKPYSEVE